MAGGRLPARRRCPRPRRRAGRRQGCGDAGPVSADAVDGFTARRRGTSPAAIESLVDRLDTGVADAAGWDAAVGRSSQTLRLEQGSRARLTADHAQAALFNARASLQPVDTDEMTMKAAVNAYTNKPA